MRNLLLFLCLLALPGFSQTANMDSLRRALNALESHPDGYTKDTLRFEGLKAIMRAYIDVNIDSSIQYNRRLIKFCKEKGLEKQLVYAHYYTGLILQVQGKHYESIQSYYSTLTMAESLKQYTQMAVLYGALAHAYSSLADNNKALSLCQQGLTVLRTHPDQAAYFEQLSLLNAVGVIYRKQKRFSEALRNNQHMYELARTKPFSLWDEANSLQAIGQVHKEQGNLDTAIAYYEKALLLARQDRSVVLEGNILVNAADIYIKQKRWQNALRYSNQAKEMAVRVKNSYILAESYEKLYKIFSQTGESERALKAYENFVLLKDSLSREQTQQRIDALHAQYDNVQKTNALQQQQVQLLQLAQTRNGLIGGISIVLLVVALLLWSNRRLQDKNRQIERQRAMLETAQKLLADINQTLETRVEERTEELVKANQELTRKNEEIKTALFKGQTIERKRVALELHDNLSSLLTAVNMSMQSINPHHLSDSEQVIYQTVKHLIQNAYAEVRNISHNILPVELEKEGLAHTLTTLIDRLNQSPSLQFLLILIGLQERLPVEIEFNIYSISLELINNIIKHAQATTVEITLIRNETGIHLSVEDDGIGLEKSQTKRGVGFQNILARLDSLGGTFSTAMSQNKGTHIDINIPIDMMTVN